MRVLALLVALLLPGVAAAQMTGISNGGPVTTTPGAISYTAQPSILLTTSVGTANTPLTNANAVAHILTVFTAPGSSGNLWMSACPAVSGIGAYAPANGGSYTFNPAPTNALCAISDNGTDTISAAGG